MMVRFVFQMRKLRLEEYATSPSAQISPSLVCHPSLTQDNDLLPHTWTPHGSGNSEKENEAHEALPFRKAALPL